MMQAELCKLSSVLCTFAKFYAKSELKSDNICRSYEITCITEGIRLDG